MQAGRLRQFTNPQAGRLRQCQQEGRKAAFERQGAMPVPNVEKSQQSGVEVVVGGVSITAPERAYSTNVVSTGPKDLVIAKGCSQFGLFRMEIIRPRVAVDEAKWIKAVENEAEKRGVRVEWKAQFAYEENEAGFWHLRLYWKEVASGSENG